MFKGAYEELNEKTTDYDDVYDNLRCNLEYGTLTENEILKLINSIEKFEYSIKELSNIYYDDYDLFIKLITASEEECEKENYYNPIDEIVESHAEFRKKIESL